MSEKYDITLREGLSGAKPRKVAKKRMNREGSWFYLGMVGQIGYTIAIPLVLGAFLGSLVGQTLIGLGIGIIISVIGFVRIIKNLL